jgi:NarL family two-component system response regulator LiaR
MSIRLVLADDHRVLRQGLRALLETEPDMEVVGEADTGRAAIDVALQTRPDVVLMDLIMPEMDGITATQILHEQQPESRVLILSSMEEEGVVTSAVRAGAIGIVRKSVPIETVVQSIRAAAQGQVQFSPAATAHLVREMQTPTESPERLTARECEVLQFVAEGLANKAIAWKLRISEKTVKSHVSTILGKFGLESRTQAALYAARNGLVGAEVVPLPQSERLTRGNIVSMEMVRCASTARDRHARRTRPVLAH